MRRILSIVATGLFALTASAGMLQPDLTARGADARWIKRAPAGVAAIKEAVVEAQLAEVNGTRPIVLLETNYYTFLPGEPLQLRMTTDANGFNAPVTMYLYSEDRNSGERRYYTAAGTQLGEGQQSDLFGSPEGGPVPVFVPNVSDLVLFGGTETSDLSWGAAGALGGSITVPAGQPGLYQFVLELRDAEGKRVIARSNAAYSHVTASVAVSGTISQSTTWTADKRYVLSDFVGLSAPAVLTIEPGTVIYGGDSRASLFVARGAKIIADGTNRRPIVFTSPQRVGSRNQSDWGSLVLLGRAPLNVPGGSAFMEGLPSQEAYAFGGNDAQDSSGVLRYVRLEFGGFAIATDREINGLTLAGIGSGTVIDHVQVLHNADDAFEFFGGTVNAKHLLGVGYADDGLDFDLGYTGAIQYAALIKRANDEADGNIITESDNNGEGSGNAPLTDPTVYNVTGIRIPATNGNYGAVLRRNTAGDYHNVIVLGSKNAPLNLRDASTNGNATSGALVWDNSIFSGSFDDAAYPGRSDAAQSRAFALTTNSRNRNIDPMLAIGAPTLLRTFMPDLEPLASSPALDVDFVGYPADGFLDAVDFQGAVGPGDNWVLSGWANFSDN